MHVDGCICTMPSRINIGGQRSMKLNNIVSTRIIVTVCITVFCVLAGYLWWIDAMRPVDKNDVTPIMFVVPRGQGSKEISKRLAIAGLVRSQIGFYLLVRFFGTDGQIQSGDFRLNKSMDAKTIASELTHGMVDVWITTLEGWRDEEIAMVLSKDLNLPEKEFLQMAQEGYMFPDTYLIPKDATAGAIVSMFIDNFNKKVTPEMLGALKNEGITKDELVAIASLVEREGRTSTDRPIIAGILLNRFRRNWPLQVDATLQYALGYQQLEKTWWKKELTDEDKKINSPYNTYLNPGLPPAPIANPGLEAIKAVIYPQVTDYMFYLHDTAGVAHYAKTIEEHLENTRAYLQ